LALVFITNVKLPLDSPVITLIPTASSPTPVVLSTCVVLTGDQALSPHEFWPLTIISAVPRKEGFHVTWAVSTVP
jgi:hypothetical protein